MRKTKVMIAVMLLAWGSVSAQNWKPEEVKTIIANVNNSWQKRHPANRDRAFWDPAVYHTGNMEAYFLFCESNDEMERETADRWRKYSKRWGERNFFLGASEIDPAKWRYKNYGEGPQYVLFGDWQICFQTYIDLYNYSSAPQESWIARAKEVMSYEAYSSADDYWWWADALYMVMPVMTKMYLLTGDEAYLDKMYANWKYANSIMYDKDTGLYFRDGKYVYPKHTTRTAKKDCWARGDGWVIAAFAKVLKDFDTARKQGKKVKSRYRKEISETYKQLAKALVNCQQQEGYWTRSILDPEQAPGYETSGTALMCYGLFWGINNGYLPKTYIQSASKAWKYLSTIALQPDNTIGYVQPIGEKAIPGQVVDKKSISNFGTGAFLLAASEYCRFLSH
jgi:rhamnogalacturonyl hydrolase YesR